MKTFAVPLALCLAAASPALAQPSADPPPADPGFAAWSSPASPAPAASQPEAAPAQPQAQVPAELPPRRQPAAAEPQTYDPDAAEMPASAAVYARKPRENLVNPTEGSLLAPSETVDANDLLDEILDELAADLARLGSAQISPLLLERIRVSDNMDPNFAKLLEARLVASLERAASVAVVRCFECFATRGRIESSNWVVSRGITRKEDLAATAEKYGAKMLFDAQLTLYTRPNSLALDVELVRPDGTIAFAEGYRVHPHTALLYRSADRAQKREARLKDLEARLNARPQFSQGFYLGGMLLPTADAPEGPVLGAYASYRLFEKFGVDREWRVGLSAGVFSNLRRLPFVTRLGGVLQLRLTPDNVYVPACHGGGDAGYYVAPTLEGIVGTPYVGASAECVLIHRIAIQGSLDAVLPFRMGSTGYTYGFLVPQLGVEVAW